METIERNPEKILLSDAAESFNNKDYIRAKKCIIQLLNINPGKGEYFSGLGIINKKIGRLKEAEENFLSAINKNPSLYEAYYNLGILYHENKIYESAVKYYTASLKINPNLHLAYYNLGNLYRELDQFSKASEFYKMAAAIKLDYPDAYYNLGVISEKLYDFNSALQYYKKTLLVDPGHVEAHWNKSLMHLLLGDFENGWKDYEWRVKRKEADTRYFPGPYLIDQDINGKTIFVYSEQGLGDVIQFSRYFPLLKKAGANIIFECNSSLYDLFKRVNYIDILFKEGNDNFQVEYDYQISVLSLPFFFKTKLNTIPDKIPYLFSDAALSEELKPVMRREKKLMPE
jgi:tetratricopeptide (TPR) repeat protein